MPAGESLEFSGTVERKDPSLPCYMVIPSDLLESWSLRETTVIEGALNDTELGRRTLKPWGADRWFVELPKALCRKAGISVGDRVNLRIRRASTRLPRELAALIESDRGARRAWDQMSPSRQRMLREHVIAAKRPATRQRRAERALKL